MHASTFDIQWVFTFNLFFSWNIWTPVIEAERKYVSMFRIQVSLLKKIYTVVGDSINIMQTTFFV